MKSLKYSDKKVDLFFIFQSHIDFMFGIELELIENSINAGRRPIVVCCNGELRSCEANPYHFKSICKNCIYKRNFGLKLLNGKVEKLSLGKFRVKQDKDLLNSYSKINRPRDLFSIVEEDKFDIGFGIASSIISRYRDYDLDLSMKQNLVKSHAIAASYLFKLVKLILTSLEVDRVYNFNGRGFLNRAIFRASKIFNINYYSYERGSTKDKYALFYDCLPHSYKFIKDEADKAWDCEDSNKRILMGKAWFEDRMKGKDQEWINFSKNQSRGLLPEGFDSNCKKVVIFNSSEDEFAAIGNDYQNPLYKDQIEGLEKIVQDLKNKEGIIVFIRMHPNLENVDNHQTRSALSLNGNNIHVIPSSSKISTYDLLLGANVVITFGSQVGIEAVYWGKPSILAGKSRYCLFPGIYQPNSHSELLQMIDSNLSPQDNMGAIKFGYYFNTFGIDFKNYKTINFNEGLYKGKRIPWGKKDHFRHWYPNLFNLYSEIYSFLKKIFLAK